MKPRYVLPLAVLAVLLLAAPAEATSPGDSFVVLTGHLDVPEGKTFSNAVIFNGDATIEGTVTGNVVAINGDVIVTGAVDGNVAALNGRAVVNEGAHVHGDVTSRLVPQVAPGTVDGSVGQMGSRVNLTGLRFASRFAIWVGATVSSFILGLLLLLFAPRALEAAALVGSGRTGAAVGWGVVLLIGIPIAAVVALVTVVGLPLGLGVLLALALVYWVGWVGGAFVLGRRLVKLPASRMKAFAAGWGILRVIAIVPVLASLVWVAATVVGLGSLALAARRAGRPAPEVPARPPGTPPLPPLPA